MTSDAIYQQSKFKAMTKIWTMGKETNFRASELQEMADRLELENELSKPGSFRPPRSGGKLEKAQARLARPVWGRLSLGHE